MAPQIIEMASKLKSQGTDNVFADFVYIPMIRGKGGVERPDPHYPKGIHYSIPGWMAMTAFLAAGIGGLMLLATVMYAVTRIPAVRHTTGIKEILGALKL